MFVESSRLVPVFVNDIHDQPKVFMTQIRFEVMVWQNKGSGLYLGVKALKVSWGPKIFVRFNLKI